MRRVICLAVFLLFLVPVRASAADALRGYALVIGQSGYESLEPLENPANDARGISRLLDDLGFEVTRVLNADADELAEELKRFSEDAADADVVLIYYAGHGIESGGENYLIPVDADMSTPQKAGEKLVSLSSVLDDLRARVPVTIFLLDACRTNSFPGGLQVQLPGSTEVVSLTAEGLDTTRGPTALTAPKPPAETLGTVIGFSASPGQPALDGPKGGNSPYAAALLRHLGATEYSFGDLMTMISEEVYLKTNAQQLPWVNSSLRRVLTFGRTLELGDPDEATITSSRRNLLLTISETPDADKQLVENVAHAEGLPLDAVFGVLKAVLNDSDLDGGSLDQQLRDGTRRLQSILEERAALSSTDPELHRLAKLAETAIREGAIDAAIAFNEKAKTRVRELSSVVDAAEEDVVARRREFAAVFADSAKTFELQFDFRSAAADWRSAIAEIEKWDTALALDYVQREAEALTKLGEYRADRGALERAIEVLQKAIADMPASTEASSRAAVQAHLGKALRTLGSLDTDTHNLEASIAAYRAAIAAVDREQDPLAWAGFTTGLGTSLGNLGSREPETHKLEESNAAYRDALSVLDRDRDAADWAAAMSSLASGLSTLGERQGSLEAHREAVGLMREAIAATDREVEPLLWGGRKASLGSALWKLGQLQADYESFEQAIAATRESLEERTQDRVPQLWADSQMQLGIVLDELGDRRKDSATELEGVAAYRAALEETSRIVDPLGWARIQNNIAVALYNVGYREKDDAILHQALGASALALQERRRDLVPLQWATSKINQGVVFEALGDIDGDISMLERGAQAYRDALEVWTRQTGPLYWATVQNNLGVVLRRISDLAEDYDVETKAIDEAIEAFRLALEERTKARAPVQWAQTQNSLGRALLKAGEYGEAVAVFHQALEIRTAEALPIDYAVTQSNLGDALVALYDSGIENNETLESAIAAYRAALRVRTIDMRPYSWGWDTEHLGQALLRLGEREGSLDILNEARAATIAAGEGYRRDGSNYDSWLEGRVSEIDLAIAALTGDDATSSEVR